MVPFEKSETVVSLASSVIKNIVYWFSGFPAKFICCIAFGSASIASYLLKSIAMILQSFLK